MKIRNGDEWYLMLKLITFFMYIIVDDNYVVKILSIHAIIIVIVKKFSLTIRIIHNKVLYMLFFFPL